MMLPSKISGIFCGAMLNLTVPHYIDCEFPARSVIIRYRFGLMSRFTRSAKTFSPIQCIFCYLFEVAHISKLHVTKTKNQSNVLLYMYLKNCEVVNKPKN